MTDTSPVSRESTAIERFWARINKNGPVPAHAPSLGLCWVWTGATAAEGYGHLRWNGRPDAYAHRVALEIASGLTLQGRRDVVGHICDTPACVRNDTPGFYEVKGVLLPSWGHLFRGTSATNAQDRDQKGRAAVRRGEQNSRVILTEANVRCIRALQASGQSSRQIAARFEISHVTVWKIIARRSWRHVSDDSEVAS